MKQEVMFQKRGLYFTHKNIVVISLLIIIIFSLQSSLFAQVKSNTTGTPSNTKDSVNDITIHQEVTFKVSPQRLYGTLLSSKEFSACTKKSFNSFTESSASIDSTVGGTFSLFDGHIIGRILELVPNERIVEAWRVVD